MTRLSGEDQPPTKISVFLYQSRLHRLRRNDFATINVCFVVAYSELNRAGMSSYHACVTYNYVHTINQGR